MTATPATEERTWLQLAEAEISRLQLNPELLEVLRAFGGDKAPGPPTLDHDDDADGRDGGGDDSISIPSLISSSLASEVDADQARMFARRFASVSSLLSGRGTPTSSLLRLGLHRRARQILSFDPPPRALRIRALVDFVWSQALVLGNAESLGHLPSVRDLVEKRGGVKYDEFAPGMYHGTIEGETSGGPVHVNVLRVRRGAATLRTVDARTTEGGSTDLTELAAKCGAAAAVSGGFFLYSEPDIRPPSRRMDPVGLLVTDGKVVGPPAFRRAALLQDGETGEISIHRVGMDGVAVRIGGDEGGNEEEGGEDGVPVRLVVGSNGVRCMHRGDRETVSLAKDEAGISIVGTKVFRISKSDADKSDARTIAVPLAGFVLVIPASLLGNDSGVVVGEGDPASYEIPGHPHLRAAMTGGPLLLNDGRDVDDAVELLTEDFRGSAPPVTFSQDETFDRNLLPRMGAGLTADGELVLAAVDCRNLDRALGLTLRGTADLLAAALGCVRALNLDGGSSKRMVIRGEVVCLSTTEIKASRSEGGGNKGEGEGEEKPRKVEKTPELSRPVHSVILYLERVTFRLG